MDFKRLIKCKVMSQLKPQRRNIAPSGQILIKKSLYEKFSDFGVTGRYTSNEAVMEFLDLEERRYIAANKFTFLKKETFQVRISSEKKVRFLNQSLEECEMQSGYYVFCYRFIRHQN